MGHRAIPGLVVGHNWLKARQLNQPPPGALSEPMRAGTEEFQANLLDEFNRGRHCQISRRIARAGPDELVRPPLDRRRLDTAPA